MIDVPAFADDDTLHAALAPHLSRAAFGRAISEMEHRGFPKRHPVFKGRYMPAVRKWLDGNAGLGPILHGQMAQDGAETWEDGANAIADTRSQKAAARGGGAALLERSGAVTEGRQALPGRLDPFTRRRHSRGD